MDLTLVKGPLCSLKRLNQNLTKEHNENMTVLFFILFFSASTHIICGTRELEDTRDYQIHWQMLVALGWLDLFLLSFFFLFVCAWVCMASGNKLSYFYLVTFGRVMKRVWYLPGRLDKEAIWDQSVYFMVSWEMERL